MLNRFSYLFVVIMISCGVINFDNSRVKYITLHGIDVSDDGERVFVSDRGDGKLHIFNANDGSRIQSIKLSDNAANRIKEIMSSADKTTIGVRVGVRSGGCAFGC